MKIYAIDKKTLERFEVSDLYFFEENYCHTFDDSREYRFEFEPEIGDVVAERMFEHTYLDDCDIIQETLLSVYGKRISLSVIDAIWKIYSENVNASWLCLYADIDKRTEEIVNVFKDVVDNPPVHIDLSERNFIEYRRLEIERIRNMNSDSVVLCEGRSADVEKLYTVELLSKQQEEKG